MMTRRRETAGLSIPIATACLVTGCTSIAVTREETNASSWSLGVSYPEGRFEDCGEDAAVAEGVMSMSDPTSSHNLTLKAGSGQKDAARIAACFRDELSSGTVTVFEPREHE